MFYSYHQNNSGGSFQIDDKVTTYVIIEADTANEANEVAEGVGLYFDGYGDCECCGSRWSSAWSGDGTAEPEIYGAPANEYKSTWVEEGEPSVYVYYKDGRKESY